MARISRRPLLTSAGAYAGSSDIEATGTKGMLIIAGTPKGVNPLDPKQIEPALRAGYERSKSEAEKIRQFWA